MRSGRHFFCQWFVTVSFSLLPVCYFTVSAQPDGKQLYQTNCARCHKLSGELVGPALEGVEDRVPKPAREWLVKWIRNSQELVKAGDPYAKTIFGKYNNIEMSPFPDLKDEEIHAILDYVKQGSQPAVTSASGTTGTQSGGGIPEQSLQTMLVVLLIVLVLIAFALSAVTRSLGRIVKERAGESIHPPLTLPGVLKSRKLIATASIGALVFLSVWVYEGAAGLGKQQGYTPDQPIVFSHKIHAGKLRIDCKYCHFGAEKSKTAGIPSMNVCMNCHKAVTESQAVLPGNIAATGEIVKVRDAFAAGRAVEWIRVHNLPDHVFFSHAQHVSAGKQECQTCHGPVQEMDVIRQEAPLSMGWCVNCHRKTEVQFATNNYYSGMFAKLHEDLKSGKIDKITVDKIGGIDCQKCHY